MSRFHREQKVTGGGPAIKEPYIPSGDQLPQTHPANVDFFINGVPDGADLRYDITHLLLKLLHLL